MPRSTPISALRKKHAAFVKVHQPIFETVASHLLIQGKESQRYDKAVRFCAYRGDNGLKCAIGCLIKDRFYDAEKLERRSVDTDAVMTALFKSGISRKVHPDFLERLQTVHDDTDPKQWGRELIHVAVEFGLSTIFMHTILDELDVEQELNEPRTINAARKTKKQ